MHVIQPCSLLVLLALSSFIGHERERERGEREGEVTRRYGKVDLVGWHNEGRWHEKEKLHPVHLGSLPAG
jgi:hypothetical protein